MGTNIDTCPDCGSHEFREEITGGIKQTVIYRNGYIVKEINEYAGKYKDRKGFCNKCGREFEEYEF